jgi:hypothetical protein
MKKKLRAIIALLKSRAYLDSQQEAAERKHTPREDSHHEYEGRENDKSQCEAIEHQHNARAALFSSSCVGRLKTAAKEGKDP